MASLRGGVHQSDPDCRGGRVESAPSPLSIEAVNPGRSETSMLAQVLREQAEQAVRKRRGIIKPYGRANS
jgi:hypothetical protein